jgi:hypothetical protein
VLPHHRKHPLPLVAGILAKENRNPGYVVQILPEIVKLHRMTPQTCKIIRVDLCLSVVPFFLALVFVVMAQSAVASDSSSELMLPAQFRKLLPLHTALEKPRPGDWLAEHAELGQTFRQYLRGNPIKAEGKRRKIYIQPLGSFTGTQQKVLDHTAEFMGLSTTATCAAAIIWPNPIVGRWNCVRIAWRSSVTPPALTRQSVSSVWRRFTRPTD